MAGLLRAALATLVAPPPSVVDLARRLRFRDRAVVDIDLAALSARGTSGAGDRVLLALEWLRNDPMVRGVRIRLDGARGSWATLQAWHAGIRRLVSGGTPVFVEVGAVGNTELFLASAASRIFMLPAGSVEATGLATRMHFFGDVLERLGVQVEVFAAGDYKSAGETLSRSCPSAANREAVQALLDDLQDQLVGAVAAGRGLEVQAVRDALAAAPFTADRALQLGLVDDLAHHDQVRERLEGDLPCEPVHVSFGTWWRWVRFRDLWRRMAGAGAPVAVVRLRGPGVERRAEPGGRDVIAADRVVRLLERVREADAVRGVLLTVDSGGGSVLASERIWRAVQRLQEAKPVVALFQGVAASGGYYLAAPIRSIFVHPGTVTGSI